MCDYGFMDRCGLFLVFRGKLRVRNFFQVLSYVTSFKGNDPLGSIGVWSVARWFWVRVHQLAWWGLFVWISCSPCACMGSLQVFWLPPQ